MRRTEVGAGQRVASGLIAGAVVLMAGCSAEEQQVSTELPSASSRSAEATPELPALGPPDLPMPAEARRQDETGAEAFLRYYVDVYNQAQRTVDSTYMRQLSRGCDTCDRISDGIDRNAAAGNLYEGGEVSLGDIYGVVVQGDEAQLGFAVSQDPLVITNGGSPVADSSYPANASKTDGSILTWDDGRDTWVMRQWDTA